MSRTLVLDTSSVAASAALWDGDRPIYTAYANLGLTHSQTILPMVEQLLASCGLTMADISLLGTTVGPGSFTGLRIGLATVQGLAFAHGIPCVGISTTEALAEGLYGWGGLICAVMDARRSQVYNALFDSRPGAAPTRLCGDRAIAITELCAELESSAGPIFLVGDGAQLCYTVLKERGLPVQLAPSHLRLQNAALFGPAILRKYLEQGAVPPAELQPVYLRLSQAERERLERGSQI